MENWGFNQLIKVKERRMAMKKEIETEGSSKLMDFLCLLEGHKKVDEEPSVKAVEVGKDPVTGKPIFKGVVVGKDPYSVQYIELQNLVVQRMLAIIKEKNNSTARMADTPDQVVQWFNDIIKEEKVAEEAQLKGGVFINPYMTGKDQVAEEAQLKGGVFINPYMTGKDRSTARMVDWTDQLDQHYNAFLKEKEKVAEEAQLKGGVFINPYMTGKDQMEKEVVSARKSKKKQEAAAGDEDDMAVDKAAEITIGDAEDHKSEKKEKRKLDQEVGVHDKVVDDSANADSSKKKKK